MPALEPELSSELRGWIDATVQRQVETSLRTALESIAADIHTRVERMSEPVYPSPLDQEAVIGSGEVRQRVPSAVELELRSLGYAIARAFEQALSTARSERPAVRESLPALRASPDEELPATLAEVRTRSLSTAEAAARLGVNPSRIRQRLLSRTLYGFKAGSGWWLPELQFDGDHTVPGIDRIFPELRPSASPVAVCRWFLTPWADLIVDEDLELVVSPRRWLLTGGDPQPVIAQARTL